MAPALSRTVCCMDDDMAARTDAFEQTVRSTLELGATLGEDEWELPTECPGWSVKDTVAHVIGTERGLLGDPEIPHTPPTDLPHVRNDLARRNEVAVDARRSWSPAQVHSELQEVLDRRLDMLRSGTIDPAAETDTPFGRKMPYAEFMIFRAFDCWVHEQDIRRAVHRPGNLDAPAAECARSVLTNALPYVVGKPAGTAPGQSVTVDVSGPPTFTRRIHVGDDGRARTAKADGEESTATLRMDWETFVRLGCGRCGPESVPVDVTGDADLASRVLANLAITP